MAFCQNYTNTLGGRPDRNCCLYLMNQDAFRSASIVFVAFVFIGVLVLHESCETYLFVVAAVLFPGNEQFDLDANSNPVLTALNIRGASPPPRRGNLSLGEHDISTLTTVHAWTRATAHAYTMAIVNAYDPKKLLGTHMHCNERWKDLGWASPILF